MNHRETVSMIMDMFVAEYPGRFSTGLERLKVWCQMLKGFDGELILGAAYHLASTCNWPPTIAQMREQCVLMSHGDLRNPTGAESWERIRRKMTSEPDLELTDLERTALSQTSSLYDLKRSTNPSTDRAHYIKAFDSLAAQRHQERITLPEVKALAGRYAEIPALEAGKTDKALPVPSEDKGDVMSFEEAKEQFGPQLDALATMIGGE